MERANSAKPQDVFLGCVWGVQRIAKRPVCLDPSKHGAGGQIREIGCSRPRRLCEPV